MKRHQETFFNSEASTPCAVASSFQHKSFSALSAFGSFDSMARISSATESSKSAVKGPFINRLS